MAFDDGVKAYQAGDYPTALERFREAYSFKQHPAVGLNLALAESKTGLLIEAIERFDTILVHPEASEKLKETARRERETVEGNLSVLVLEVVGGSDKSEVVATVDGKPMSGKPPQARLNPGSHHVRVAEGDRVLLGRNVDLGLGERLRISVQRSREVVVVPDDKPAPAPTPTPQPIPETEGLDPIWFYVGVGATVVLSVTSVWSALDTKGAFDEFERDLPTLPQDEINRRVGEGNSKETRTNVLLGVTTLAAVGTAVMGVWLVDWNGKPKTESSHVAITPGGVLVRGSF